MPARIGIMGGTFDPPHCGHVAVAAAAQEQLELHEVKIIPAGQSPMRLGSAVASAEQRATMCRLAFAGLSWAKIDERELRRVGPSWSIDTVLEIASENPYAKLVWILGADQLAQLHRWKDIARLGQCVDFAVFTRIDLPCTAPPECAAFVRLIVLKADAIGVSSTDIRESIRRGDLCRNCLPMEVARYIDVQSLYHD